MRTAVLATLAIAAATPAFAAPMDTASFARDVPAYASDESGALSLKTLTSIVGAGAPIVGAIVDHFTHSGDDEQQPAPQRRSDAELWARGKDAAALAKIAANLIPGMGRGTEAALKAAAAAAAAKGKPKRELDARGGAFSKNTPSAAEKAAAAAKAAHDAKSKTDNSNTRQKLLQEGRKNAHGLHRRQNKGGKNRRDVWERDLVEELARRQSKGGKNRRDVWEAERDFDEALARRQNKGGKNPNRREVWERDLVEELARRQSKGGKNRRDVWEAERDLDEALARRQNKGGKNRRDVWERDLVEVLARSLEELD